MLIALFIATLSVSIEALLFRGLLEIGQSLDMVGQRIGAVTALFIFLIGLLLLEFPIASIGMRMARRLEVRLRIAFLEKIPHLSDHYFHSRLTSDMTQRAYELRQLRTLPSLGTNFIRLIFQILLTVTGVILLNPGNVHIAILATIFAVGISFITQPVMTVPNDFSPRIFALRSFIPSGSTAPTGAKATLSPTSKFEAPHTT